MLNALFKKLLGNTDSKPQNRLAPLKGRRLHIEHLECRELLAVTIDSGDFATIKTQYSDLNLGNFGDYNIIEVSGLGDASDSNHLAFSEQGLKAAITRAGQTTDNDLIVVRTTTSQNTITLTGVELSINNINANTLGSVTIVSLGDEPLTVDADQLSRVFNISGSTTKVGLGGLTITGGNTSNYVSNYDGGGINNAGTLIITHSTISNNTALGYDCRGGGINNIVADNAGTLTVTHSTISNNTASGYGCRGGGISGDNLTVEYSVISGNKALGSSSYLGGGQGGGIYDANGISQVKDSKILGNTASGNSSSGGGIYSYYYGYITGTQALTRCTISGNSAYHGGGVAINLYPQTNNTSPRTPKIDNCVISGNSAYSGGGIYYSIQYGLTYWYGGVPLDQMVLRLTNVTVVGNTVGTGSSSQGGGIYNAGCIEVRNSIIAYNRKTTITGEEAENVRTYSDIGSRAYTDVRYSLTDDVANSTFGNTFYSFNPSLFPIYQTNIVGTSTNPVDPLFRKIPAIINASTTGGNYDPEDWDLQLQVTSPAIDAGDDGYISNPSTAIDILGNPRISGDRVDMGAYEFQFIMLTGITTSTEFPKVGETIYTTLLPSGAMADYQWYRIKNNVTTVISGATFSSYTPTGDDLGYFLKVEATGDKSQGYYDTVSHTLTNATTMDLIGITTSTELPEVGTQITTTLLPNGATATYQWYRGTSTNSVTTPISGAESSSYTPTIEDVGYYLRVEAKGTEYCIGTVSHTLYYVVPVPTTIIVTNPYDNGKEYSLRWAIEKIAEGGTILFASSLTDETITLAGMELFIDKSLTIDASGRNITVDADHASRVFHISGSATDVSLVGLTMTGGYTTDNGGGIYNDGAMVTITDCTISGNTSESNGGGIYNNGTLTVTGSVISGNASEYSEGGGIYSGFNGVLTVTNCEISGNSAAYTSGGIYNEGTSTIASSVIAGNTADAVGGILNYGAMTLTNSVVAGNAASLFGGIVNFFDTLTITNCTIAGNTADDTVYGSGIATLGPVELYNTIIAHNTGADIDLLSIPFFYGIILTGEVSGANNLVGNGIHFSPAIGTTSSNVAVNTIVTNMVTVAVTKSPQLTGYGSGYSGGSMQTSTSQTNFTLEHGINGNIVGTMTNPIDPLFMMIPNTIDASNTGVNYDPLDWNLRLQSGSVAIDAGDDFWAKYADESPIEFDLAGNLRIIGLAVDMGAYEFQPLL